MEQQASFVCKTRRRHALTLTLTCRLSRSLSLTTDLKPCSKPNRNQVGSRLQKAKDEAQVPKAEEEEDSLYAGVGDFEFDVSPPARPGPGRSLPRPEHAAALCAHAAAGRHRHGTIGRRHRLPVLRARQLVTQPRDAGADA